MKESSDNDPNEVVLTTPMERSGRDFSDTGFLVAILMVSAAKGDGSISQPETDQMIDTLGARLGASSAEAMEYLTNAVTELADEQDFATRLPRLASEFSREQKESAFSMMLQITMADGHLNPAERDQAVSTGMLLGLPIDEIHAAIRAVNSAAG